MCLTQLTDIVLTGKDKEVHNGMILVGLNRPHDSSQKDEIFGFKHQ